MVVVYNGFEIIYEGVGLISCTFIFAMLSFHTTYQNMRFEKKNNFCKKISEGVRGGQNCGLWTT